MKLKKFNEFKVNESYDSRLSFIEPGRRGEMIYTFEAKLEDENSGYELYIVELVVIYIMTVVNYEFSPKGYIQYVGPKGRPEYKDYDYYIHDYKIHSAKRLDDDGDYDGELVAVELTNKLREDLMEYIIKHKKYDMEKKLDEFIIKRLKELNNDGGHDPEDYDYDGGHYNGGHYDGGHDDDYLDEDYIDF